MLEIRSRIDDKVVINDSEVRSLYFNLITEQYVTIELIHGSKFMDALIKIYEEVELYETCARIVKQRKELADLKKSLFPDGPLSPE